MELSFKQYRTIDLTILLVIYAIAEAVTARAAKYWFPGEIYFVSPTVAMLCIIMMRWGAYALVHAVAGGLVLCLAIGAGPEQFVIYCIGNCLAVVALLWFKTLGKEKVRTKAALTILYVLSVFCLVQTGRWLVGLAFGGTLKSFGSFFAYDSLSLVFAIVVVLLTRRLDGVFEDQKSYLIRTQSQRRKESMTDGDYDE
ncbi:MAG: hypothetical protein IKR27_07515 [Lachnospiraceae bacterium]|nr:hypothetical protein [Lachnospiraceae bacterium]